MGSDKLFQRKKIRSEKELARREAKKAPHETILIVCEDSKSSLNIDNWSDFKKKLDKHLPAFGDTIPLALNMSDDDGIGI